MESISPTDDDEVNVSILLPLSALHSWVRCNNKVVQQPSLPAEKNQIIQ